MHIIRGLLNVSFMKLIKKKRQHYTILQSEQWHNNNNNLLWLIQLRNIMLHCIICTIMLTIETRFWMSDYSSEHNMYISSFL